MTRSRRKQTTRIPSGLAICTVLDLKHLIVLVLTAMFGCTQLQGQCCRHPDILLQPDEVRDFLAAASNPDI